MLTRLAAALVLLFAAAHVMAPFAALVIGAELVTFAAFAVWFVWRVLVRRDGWQRPVCTVRPQCSCAGARARTA